MIKLVNKPPLTYLGLRAFSARRDEIYTSYLICRFKGISRDNAQGKIKLSERPPYPEITANQKPYLV